MRLYNPTPYSKVGSAKGHGVHHFNQPRKMAPSTTRCDDSWKIGGVAPYNPEKPQTSAKMRQTKSSANGREVDSPPRTMVSLKNRVHSLKIVWPPISVEDESKPPDNQRLSIAPTASTATSSTLVSPSSDENEKYFNDGMEPSKHLNAAPSQEAGPPSPEKKNKKNTPTPSKQLQEDEMQSKTPPKQRRRFTSAFQSPLRLSKLQLRSSPKLFQRKKGRLQPECSVQGGECDPIFSSADSNETFAAPAEKKNGETPMFSFQSPIRAKFESLRKKRQEQSPQKSPALSNNETHTTATSETFDALPGRVSSESFYFDIDFVKSMEEEAEPEEFYAPPKLRTFHEVVREQEESVISKSSSSTITSNWYNEEDEIFSSPSQDCAPKSIRPFPNSSPIADGHRPVAPAPWPAMDGFVMRSDDGFVEGPLLVDGDLRYSDDDESALPNPTSEMLASQKGNQHLSSSFESSFGETGWSDGDGEWIDFTADPFKSVSPSVVKKPQPTKPAISERESGKSRTKLILPPKRISAKQLLSQRSQLREMNSSVSRVEPTGVTMTTPSSPAKDLSDYGKDSKSNGLARSVHMIDQSHREQKAMPPVELAEKRIDLSSEKSSGHGHLESLLPAKYKKMLSVGIPMDAVRNAMARDGFDASVLDKKAGCPVSTALKAKRIALDPYRRFRVHWDSHQNVRTNTVWAMIQREAPWILKAVRIENDEYNKLFREASGDSLSTRAVKKDNPDSTSRTVIDAKRANNGGIILARIKLSYIELARAIDSVEYDMLEGNQLQGLLPFLPTTSEEIALRDRISKAGGQHVLKSECEKFMAAMMSVRDVKAKLKAMLFMKQFGVVVDGLRNDSHLVQKACEEIMSSGRLRKLLGVILELGNRLNTEGQSATKEKAAAIRLESLARLSQGKAFDRKTTFLQFIVNSLRRSEPDMLQLQEDLPSLRQAERVDLDQMIEDVAQLEARVADIRQMALRMSGDAVSSEVEVELLSSSRIGRFALDSSLKMAALYHEVESAKLAHNGLVHYFGEGVGSSNTATPSILSTVSSFWGDLESAVENAIAVERKARSSVKNSSVNDRRGVSKTLKSRRASTPDLPRSARSVFGGVLDSIRCKARLLDVTVEGS
mmetsp:Transcript_26128/g.72030  ORF Transcript_26128/g.72030 Transcript_26128/m.72030 type:complete len:1119 (+) Transcript_26128:537-3893(+)|eukprot:CAMPEP_0168722344 /NCGR_PEP_ID=MMETSP0724-20121128/2551_1 /TAXON_ID=265536 /ORGANISM="Amphiprora sp., Strain CCMP467" /LENGTH=1118 /DNA_ID=CAMNT_0008769017 /DNA_START=519 /DNA_END=3875 /DNA_ORIENTATION=+